LLKDKIETDIENAKWLQNQVVDDLYNGMKIQDLLAYTNVHCLVVK
jgi:hypothetical protein